MSILFFRPKWHEFKYLVSQIYSEVYVGNKMVYAQEQTEEILKVFLDVQWDWTENRNVTSSLSQRP